MCFLRVFADWQVQGNYTKKCFGRPQCSLRPVPAFPQLPENMCTCQTSPDRANTLIEGSNGGFNSVPCTESAPDIDSLLQESGPGPELRANTFLHLSNYSSCPRLVH